MDFGGEPNTAENAPDEIEKLEAEKKRIQDEFNLQRAKMKELFLQKEDELSRKNQENSRMTSEIVDLRKELDDLRSQLVVAGMTLENSFEQEKRKANEEIASLQQLVHETVEESSSNRSLYDSELKKSQYYIQQLQREISVLRQQKQQSPHHSAQESSLAPSVLVNALTKGIAKKLGADTFSAQDSGDENRKIDNDHTQEDPEVLCSLIGPLEDQIQALKEKLRATDEQLQKCQECGHHDLDTAATNTSFDSPKHATTCDMCSNYEDQLVAEQKKTADLVQQIQRAEKAVERHKEDLLKEIGFRKEMEEKWNEKKEEHKLQVADLTRSTECAEQDLKELRQIFQQTCSETNSMLKKLGKDREKVQEELKMLQKENENLVGKFTIHSQALQSEAINLPDTVEDLQELVLKHHQDLIIAKVGKEAAEEKINVLQSDLLLLRDQITNDQHQKECIENTLTQEIEKLEVSQRTNVTKIHEMQAQLHEISAMKKQLEDQNSELRNRVSALQQELDTSETVQRDFVRLSQSLQVQLEKIRESDAQVRWQHEEDVKECPNCHSDLLGGKQKEHCRHCGQIFCQNCLTRTVESGASMLPSKVCDVCHTLLVKSSAPYFSQAPPMT